MPINFMIEKEPSTAARESLMKDAKQGGVMAVMLNAGDDDIQALVDRVWPDWTEEQRTIQAKAFQALAKLARMVVDE